jgi:transposase InsO family protein
LVPGAESQKTLRRAFRQWGLPEHIRVDNGSPWGSPRGDLPSELALWLIGLRIDVIWNEPRRPQQNGVVERSQGTGKRWAEPGACVDVAELQSRIDIMDKIQRDEYPAIDGKSRREAFPALAHSGRPYCEEDEPSMWNLELALNHLSGYTVAREVTANGSISLGNRSRYVNAKLKGKRAFVTLDPVSVEWVVADKDGVCHNRIKADELTAERIIGLNVNNRRPPRQKPMSDFAAQPDVA